MNLFDLLSNFWRVDEQKNFSGNEIGRIAGTTYETVRKHVCSTSTDN